MSRSRYAWTGVLGLLVLAGSMLAEAAGSVDWPSVALDQEATRESALEQITPQNVARLKPAWFADLTAISHRAFEATPLVVDGHMYISTAWSVVLAFDAVTGRELWRFDPKVQKDSAKKGCCGPVSRGVAYADGLIFLAAFDGRLIALDATSGKPQWMARTFEPSTDYTITGAPLIVGENLVIGNGGAELGVRGFVTAYNRRNGRQAWRFYTTPPKPGNRDGAVSDDMLNKAAKTWSGDWWKLGGGGTVWDSMVYDPKLDLLYLGVGNGGPWNRKMRSAGTGDNLFLSSILALRGSSGAYVWHFQTTPGDEWDYTAAQSIILADLPVNGTPRKVLMQAPKNGFFYVLDRTTGEFLSGSNYVPVSWSKGLDAKSGRPIENGTARYSENGAPSLQQPGPLGGHNWQPMSYSVQRQLAYIPAIVSGFNYVAADANYRPQVATPNMGIDPVATSLPDDPNLVDAIRGSMHGELIAWDPVKQRAAWRVSHPVAWNGGTLTTRNGLLFQGDASGNLVAYDASNGRELWSSEVGTGIVAAPMTYEVRGEQYVAVAAGWGGGLTQVAGALTRAATAGGINRLVVFKLNGTATLPSVQKPLQELRNVAMTAAQSALVPAGKAQYERRCFSCHGSGAISGGEVPDLRYSAVPANATAFSAVVRGGALAVNGMPSFGQDLSANEAEAVRAYILERTNAAHVPAPGTPQALKPN